MNREHYRVIALISIIFFMFTVEASDSTTNAICSNNNFLKCLGITEGRCISVRENSETICSKKYKRNNSMGFNEKIELIVKKSRCTTNELVSELKINEEKLEICTVHLKEVYSKLNKKMLENSKILTEKMRKLEESQKNK